MHQFWRQFSKFEKISMRSCDCEWFINTDTRRDATWKYGIFVIMWLSVIIGAVVRIYATKCIVPRGEIKTFEWIISHLWLFSWFGWDAIFFSVTLTVLWPRPVKKLIFRHLPDVRYWINKIYGPLRRYLLIPLVLVVSTCDSRMSHGWRLSFDSFKINRG